jgi:hypothetical protein
VYRLCDGDGSLLGTGTSHTSRNQVSIHPSTLSNLELLCVHLFPILNFLTYLTATGIWLAKNTRNSYINILGLELTADIGLRSPDFEANLGNLKELCLVSHYESMPPSLTVPTGLFPIVRTWVFKNLKLRAIKAALLRSHFKFPDISSQSMLVTNLSSSTE